MLLHLCTPGDWRTALDRGEVQPPSLADVGFVHLSTPEQIHLPAQRLFADRPDVVLLVVDPARLADPVRFEPGVPGDPASMRFPHLYGPLPVAAVTAVLSWVPGYPLPPIPEPGDALARSAACASSLPVRRAVIGGEPLAWRAAGCVVGAPSHPHSREDNRLLATSPRTADELAADAEPLVTGAEPVATLLWPGADRVAADLAEGGWRVYTHRVLARWTGEARAPGDPGDAEVVSQREVHALWQDSWLEDLPAAVTAELAAREHRNDRAVRVLDVGVGRGGRVVAAGQLRIDGATASVEAMQTARDARGQGFADMVLARILLLAQDAGCDLVVLEAVAPAWPWAWYLRRGFVDVGSRTQVVRTGTAAS